MHVHIITLRKYPLPIFNVANKVNLLQSLWTALPKKCIKEESIIQFASVIEVENFNSTITISEKEILQITAFTKLSARKYM